MPRLFSARELAESALRKIGAFSINDTAADAAEMSEALKWLDLSVGELTSTFECWWLIEQTITFDLAADTASYVLSSVAGASYPANGIQFVKSAWLRDASGTDSELRMISREEYEAIEDKDASGEPTAIYIDRLRDHADRNIFVHPVPTTADFEVRIVAQNYAEDQIGQGSTGSGRRDHGWPTEWQRFLIYMTAAEIGDGPVRRLPMNEVASFRAVAGAAKAALEPYANRETRGVRRTSPWGA